MTGALRATPLLLLAAGCAAYQPQASPRVAVTYDWGRFVLWRDGRSFSAVGFTAAPVEAVAGVPEAERHARRYVRQMRTFWSFYLVGLAANLTGQLLSLDAGGAERGRVGSRLQTGGLVLIGVSLPFALVAQHSLWDAVNVYNDDLRGGRR